MRGDHRQVIMADNKACGCKGIRTCLLCERLLAEDDQNLAKPDSELTEVYSWCIKCSKAFLESTESTSQHPAHHGNSVQFTGVTIIPDFVTEDEEQFLQEHIYGSPFVLSQSGRRKQDFGPKVNFKKKKLRAEKFSGLPSYSKFVYDRMQALQQLSDFLPVELCNLEYCADRGAAIDPHFDDFWLWGERLVTLNLLSSSVLSFTKDSVPNVEVHVPLMRRSLIVVSGDARNEWKHGIHRQHIRGKRIAMTLRELTPEFLEGGDRGEEGKRLVEVAMCFEGTPVA